MNVVDNQSTITIPNMTEEKLYLRDLKGGRYFVKRFIIEGDVVHQAREITDDDKKVDISEEDDNTYLVLNENSYPFFHEFKTEFKDATFASNGDLFMDMYNNPDEEGVNFCVNFLEPFVEYGYADPDLVRSLKMQEKFNDLVVDGSYDLEESFERLMRIAPTPKLYLHDLKIGFYTVKEFVIKGEAAYQSANQVNEEFLDIPVEIGGGSYLILKENAGLALDAYCEPDNNEEFLFIKKQANNETSTEMYISFFKPYLNYAFADFYSALEMQQKFDDLLIDETIDIQKKIGDSPLIPKLYLHDLKIKPYIITMFMAKGVVVYSSSKKKKEAFDRYLKIPVEIGAGSYLLLKENSEEVLKAFYNACGDSSVVVDNEHLFLQKKSIDGVIQMRLVNAIMENGTRGFVPNKKLQKRFNKLNVEIKENV